MTNDPQVPVKDEPNAQPVNESPVVAFARQITLDWWAVITALVFAALILVGVITIPW